MRILEAFAAAIVVAVVVTIMAARVDGDLILIPGSAFLATFTAVLVKGKSTCRTRRRYTRRARRH